MPCRSYKTFPSHYNLPTYLMARGGYKLNSACSALPFSALPHIKLLFQDQTGFIMFSTFHKILRPPVFPKVFFLKNTSYSIYIYRTPASGTLPLLQIRSSRQITPFWSASSLSASGIASQFPLWAACPMCLTLCLSVGRKVWTQAAALPGRCRDYNLYKFSLPAWYWRLSWTSAWAIIIVILSQLLILRLWSHATWDVFWPENNPKEERQIIPSGNITWMNQPRSPVST